MYINFICANLVHVNNNEFIDTILEIAYCQKYNKISSTFFVILTFFPGIVTHWHTFTNIKNKIYGFIDAKHI